jgi:hypothetical protein
MNARKATALGVLPREVDDAAGGWSSAVRRQAHQAIAPRSWPRTCSALLETSICPLCGQRSHRSPQVMSDELSGTFRWMY